MTAEELFKVGSAVLERPIPLAMDDMEGLDFTKIKLKLKDAEEGPGWSMRQCNAVEEEYKRFLAPKRAYPDKEICA